MSGVVFEGKRGVIRPATRHALELLGGALAVVALGGGILAFKLASGPVSLKFMAPTFAAVLKQELGGGYGAEVGDVELSWSRVEQTLEIELKGINLYDHSGLLVAGIPMLQVGISTEGLQHGLFAPTSISLEKASILVERDATGTFSIGAPKAGTPSGGPSVLPLILDNLFAVNGKVNAGSYLSEVSVHDADLTVIDRRTGITIHAPDARLGFQRVNQGFKGRLEATASAGDQHAQLVLAGYFNLKTQLGAVDASFSPIRFSHLATISKFYAAFAPIDMPIGGTAHLDLGKKALITRADLALSGNGGQFIPGGKVENALAVQSAAFKGTYWPQTGEIAIDALTFAAGTDRGEVSGHARLRTAEGTPLRVLGASVALTAKNVGFSWPGVFADPIAIDTAEVQGDVTFGASWAASIKTAKAAFGVSQMEIAGDIAAAQGSPAMHLNGQITDFPAGEIGRYWPQGVSIHARNWVTRHVHDGRLVKGVLAINAPAGAFAAAQVDPAILNFDFRLEDGNASYMLQMPPLTNVTADMTLTPNSFTAKIDHAKILDTDFNSGRVTIAQLGVKDTPIDVEGDANGRIEQILEIVDHEPLSLVAKYGLKPSEITGDASVHLALTIPQESDEPDPKIGYAITAKGAHVSLPKIANHVTLDSGTLDLKINNDGIEGTGQVAVNGAPAQVAWRERFRDKSATPSEFKVHTVLDEEARAGLGFDAGTSITGPVTVDITARGSGPKIRTVSAQLDFTRSALNFSDFGWTKPSGNAAKAFAEVVIDKDGAVTAKDLRAQGQGIDISGNARLAADGKLLGANFPRLRVDGLVDLALTSERAATDGGLVVKLNGRFLKLGPLIKDAMSKGGDKSTMAWRVEAAIDKVTLRNDVPISGLVATVAAKGPRFTALDVRGKFADGQDLTALMSETGASTRRVAIDTTDAGHLVEAITGFNSFLGGKLSLNAKLADAAAPVTAEPTRKSHGGMEGTLRIDDFKVVNAPLLARLLTVGSLQGLSDLLNGQGIEFKRLTAPFWMEEGSIGVEDARASGPSIGITLQGVIDRRKDATNLNGTIVPAYTLNSALGSVPVLGPLFISRDGEGLFGFTYNVAGDIADPRLTVNPLSALAPGFLRRLFELGDAQAGDARPSTRTDDGLAQ